MLWVEPGTSPQPTAVEDRWILSRLESFKADTAARIEEFDFSKAAFGLYEFVYSELCDWYLELIKGRVTDAALSATLIHVLRQTLAICHPVMPFVTEELWEHVPGAGGQLPGGRISDPGDRDSEAEAVVNGVIEAIKIIRSWREVGIKPGPQLQARISGVPDEAAALIARLARLQSVADGDAAANIAIPGGAVKVFAGEGFDPAAANAKARERRKQLEAEVDRAEGKLANAAFVERAPEAVVQAEREKVARLRAALADL